MFAVLHPRNGRVWNAACLEPTQRTGWIQHKKKKGKVGNDRKRKQLKAMGTGQSHWFQLPKKNIRHPAWSSGLHPISCRSLPVWETLLRFPFWAFFALSSSPSRSFSLSLSFLHLSLSLSPSIFIISIAIYFPSHLFSWLDSCYWSLPPPLGLTMTLAPSLFQR